MSTTGPDPPALSFPRQIFAKLSPGPYLLAHLSPVDASQPALRPSGRSPPQPRPATLHTGSLANAHGSAVVRIGDTAAVCGVRAELLEIRDAPGFRSGEDSESGANKQRPLSHGEVDSLNLLVPNIELSTGCAPGHLPGQPPSALAQSLSMRILTLLHSSRLIDPQNLAIWYQEASLPDLDDTSMEVEGSRVIKAFWTLYIDILFISLDGNAFDAAWMAALTALIATKLPKAKWDEESEAILCSMNLADQIPLHVSGLPVPSTFSVIGTSGTTAFASVKNKEKGKKQETSGWILEDPDQFEDDLCAETATVVVDCSSSTDAGSARILRFEKRGGLLVGNDDVLELIEAATRRWQEWKNLLVAEL